MMKYDAIIVGGGVAGLTAATYLSNSNYRVLLCEKEDHLGELVGTFERNGFKFDAGIRAMENSGVLFPMLKQLEIDIPFFDNLVSLGIGDEIIDIKDADSSQEYQEMLIRLFPDDVSSIEKITATIHKLMDYMDILYGVENPIFKDLKHDKEYIKYTLLPWLFKFPLQSEKSVDSWTRSMNS